MARKKNQDERRLGATRANSWVVDDKHANLVRPVAPARPLRFKATPQNVTIDLERAAMIVIDMQNDFCSKDGWTAQRGIDIAPVRQPIAPLKTLLPALRRVRVPVVWLNWGNRADLMNLNPTVLHAGNPSGDGVGYGDTPKGGRSPVLKKGGWGARICDDLKPARGDIHVDKYRLSGFWDNELDSVLRNLDVKTLLFAGVNVDRCVLATMQDASFLGYDCILIDDCSATTSPEYCVRAVRFQVRNMYGFIAHSPSLLNAIDNL
jgi:nicotinamidase-related amidase